MDTSAAEQPDGAFMDVAGVGRVQLIQEEDDEACPDLWKSAANAMRAARDKDSTMRLTRRLALRHTPGEGATAKQTNGHADVSVQCLMPGCILGHNGIKNQGTTKSGGGSKTGCSFVNCKAHWDTRGHMLNADAWVNQQRRALEPAGPAQEVGTAPPQGVVPPPRRARVRAQPMPTVLK